MSLSVARRRPPGCGLFEIETSAGASPPPTSSLPWELGGRSPAARRSPPSCRRGSGKGSGTACSRGAVPHHCRDCAVRAHEGRCHPRAATSPTALILPNFPVAGGTRGDAERHLSFLAPLFPPRPSRRSSERTGSAAARRGPGPPAGDPRASARVPRRSPAAVAAARERRVRRVRPRRDGAAGSSFPSSGAGCSRRAVDLTCGAVAATATATAKYARCTGFGAWGDSREP